MKITVNIWLQVCSSFDLDIFPAGTQRLEDVPLLSYFGRDVPDHNRTKIGRIRFATSFGSAKSDLQVASGNLEIFP